MASQANIVAGLDRLAVNYRTAIDGGALHLWTEAFAKVPADVFADAVEVAIYNDEFHPTVARMRDHIGAVQRERSKARALTSEPCQACDRGWLHVEEVHPTRGRYEAVKPCPRCNGRLEGNRDRYEAERRQWRKADGPAPDATHDANPKEWLGLIADVLAEKKRGRPVDTHELIAEGRERSEGAGMAERKRVQNAIDANKISKTQQREEP